MIHRGSWACRRQIVDDIKRRSSTPERLPYYQITPLRRPTLDRKFQQLPESGVVLLIGTDSGIPMNFHSQSTWRELDAWVNELGVDPMVAIRAATYWPSVAMKVGSGRHRQRGQVRGHHRRARRRAATHRRCCSASTSWSSTASASRRASSYADVAPLSSLSAAWRDCAAYGLGASRMRTM